MKKSLIMLLALMMLFSVGFAFGSGKPSTGEGKVIELDMWATPSLTPDQLWGGPGRAFMKKVEEEGMKTGGVLHYLYRNKFNYLSVLPALIIIFIIAFYPLTYTIYLSFFKGGLARLEFVGLENYLRILKDDYFGESLRISFVYTTISVIITLIAGLAVGVLIAQPGRVIDVFKYIVIML